MAKLMTSHRVLDRLLRFIHYNFRAYQEHRSKGEYKLAAERLARTGRLIALACDNGLPRDVRIATIGTEIGMLERHVAAMFDYDRAVHYDRLLASL